MGPSKIALVHLSDIHYGEGAAIGGLRGHNELMAALLPPFLDQLQYALGDEDNQGVAYVVSGDLTVRGTEVSLTSAYGYLFGRWPDPVMGGGAMAGLGLPFDRTIIVPGNHDHWRGRFALGRHNEKVQQFVPTGSVLRVEAPRGGLAIELFGIDSSSGLRSRWRGTSVRQGGRLSDEQFARVQTWAATPSPDPTGITVKVLVCHHDIQDHGRLPKPLDSAQVDLLSKGCVRNGVFVILTGHQHEPCYVRAGSGHQMQEFTCGASLACDSRRLVGGESGALVHEVTLGDGGPGEGVVEWRVRAVTFSRDDGILRLGHNPVWMAKLRLAGAGRLGWMDA